MNTRLQEMELVEIILDSSFFPQGVAIKVSGAKKFLNLLQLSK